MKLPFLFLFVCVVAGRAQEFLTLSRPVEHSLASASADVYAVMVKAGDYVATSIGNNMLASSDVLR
jgi:hypothetical protein